MLSNAGKVRGDHDFIFYNQLKSDNGAVEHTGDNRTGEGDGDDEVIKVNLTQVRRTLIKSSSLSPFTMLLPVVKTSVKLLTFIHVVNEESSDRSVRFDLAEDYSVETAMVFGEVYRHNNEWKFAVTKATLVVCKCAISTALIFNSKSYFKSLLRKHKQA